MRASAMLGQAPGNSMKTFLISMDKEKNVDHNDTDRCSSKKEKALNQK
jgi:hypothetical protein